MAIVYHFIFLRYEGFLIKPTITYYKLLDDGSKTFNFFFAITDIAIKLVNTIGPKPAIIVSLSQGALPTNDPTEFITYIAPTMILAHSGGIFISFSSSLIPLHSYLFFFHYHQGLLIAAAGNEGDKNIVISMNYPAGSPWAIAVGSVDLEAQATPGTQSTGPSKFLNLLKPDVQGYTKICAAFGADVVDFFFFLFFLFSFFFSFHLLECLDSTNDSTRLLQSFFRNKLCHSHNKCYCNFNAWLPEKTTKHGFAGNQTVLCRWCE